jgi:hypothetical protein
VDLILLLLIVLIVSIPVGEYLLLEGVYFLLLADINTV